MDLKFSEEDAQDMTRIIQRARPNWSQKAIIMALFKAASSHGAGATLTAALRAAKDPQAQTPAAIMFDAYWTPQQATRTASHMRCVECLTKQPTDTMHRTTHGWTCNTHQEGNAA